jgi:hypothetical protein
MIEAVASAQEPPPFAVVRDLLDRGVLTSSAIEDLLAHQIAMERSQLRLEWAGLWSALALAFAFLLVAASVIVKGYAVAGTILGTVDLVALVTVFVKGRTP